MADRGTFWLGNAVDPSTGKAGADHIAVGSSDLTTHGVVVGMTGSGKTGLGIVLLEEALSAGIPVLAIDPKGDLGNLALVFPDLAPTSFEPWVNPSDAQAAGLDVAAFAAQQAQTWKDGLAAQGVGSDRLQALKAAADVTIYTPGSSAGTPINIVGSLRAPALSWDSEAEALRDEIEGTVTSLLALVGIASDPLSSREHVLLSNLIETAWRGGQNLDLGMLIGQVASPPIRKLGVFDIDQFFPPKDRTELAFRLNALVASPTFGAWGEGTPLDIQSMLFLPDGKPRCAIVYLAHLSDEERQFAVTLLLSKLVTWMRAQSGTPDLRVLTYMDEVYGYVPPTAAPPAKKPILTILKQGRAFGCGLVLATQNPVDLDYKAMSNAGTWLVGRLQTENDKARVLEALRSAAGGADIDALDASIGGLQKRQFLLVSAKASAPKLLTTRWAMSYLRGPLTKEEIERLRGPAAAAAAERLRLRWIRAHPPFSRPEPRARRHRPPRPWPRRPPRSAPTRRPSRHLSRRASTPRTSISRPPGSRRSVPRPADRSARSSPRGSASATTTAPPGSTSNRSSRRSTGRSTRASTSTRRRSSTSTTATSGPRLRPARRTSSRAPRSLPRRSGRSAEQSIERRLVDSRPLELSRNRQLKLVSRPGETADAFLQRCDEAAQAKADEEAAKIKDRLETRRDRLEDAVAQAQRRVEELGTEERSRHANELVAGAGAVLGALLGGRRSARSIASAVSGAASRRGMSARVGAKRDAATEKLEDAQADLEAIEQEVLDQIAEIDAKWKDVAAAVDTVAIRLESTDTQITALRLVWVPTT